MRGAPQPQHAIWYRRAPDARVDYHRDVQTILGWLMFVAGIIAYLGAFAMGPGPTMGDDPKQATLFTVATALLIVGLVLLLVI